MNAIEQQLRRISAEAKKTPAQRMVESLCKQHHANAVDLKFDDDKAPAWFVHLPGGGAMRVERIDAWGPFVKFTGFEAGREERDVVLLAPEQVAVSITTLPPESDEPRFPIGFGDWPDTDIEPAA